MTKDEILKIKEHIEIHARREPYAIKITEIMWRAVDELEHIAELEKEVAELKELKKKKEEIDIMTNFCKTCKKMHTDWLIKAKELIENIIRVTWGEGWNYSLDWKVKAEQFLKVARIIKE